jgi:ribonuclease HI
MKYTRSLTGIPLNNNIAEIAAVITAISVYRHSILVIHTDSALTLKLCQGGLLELETKGWPSTPCTSSLDPTVSYKPLLMHLLSALRAHRRVTIRKVKAHSGDANNEAADELANQGRLAGKPRDLSKLTHLDGWIDPAPQLKDHSLKQITEMLVERVHSPPSSTTKIEHFKIIWESFLDQKNYTRVLAPSCLPLIWKLTVPTPIKEILWKWTLSALPLGHRFRSASELGRQCRCGAELTLPHLWKSCPTYDLTPLLSIADDSVKKASMPEMKKTGHPGLIQPLGTDSLYWLPLVAITYLERATYTKHTTLAGLTKTRSRRCSTLGRTLWHIWKCRMKEIFDPTYLFIPSRTLATLTNALNEPP